MTPRPPRSCICSDATAATCCSTDPCLLAAYDDDQATRLAQAELNRAVPALELQQWRDRIARPQALLLGEAAAAARRIFVYSATLADQIRTRYRREAIVLPSPTPPPLLHAHAAGLWAECCVWAVELLADWHIDVRLHLAAPEAERPTLAALADRLGMADRVGAGTPAIRMFLAMRGAGPLAPQAIEAASAGLPLILTRSLQEAAHLPAITLEDQPSPPLLAEAIASALQTAPPPGLLPAADRLWTELWR